MRLNLGKMIMHLQILTDDENNIVLKRHQKIAVLNAALQHLSHLIFRFYPKFYLEAPTVITSEPGKNTMDMPENCSGKIANIKKSDGSLLFKNHVERFDPTETGTPDQYDIIGRKICLNRIPLTSENYTLTYYRNPSEMAEETDYPDFPYGYEMCIVYWGIFSNKLKTSDSLDGIYGLFSKSWSQMKASLLEDPQTYQVQGVTKVVQGPGGYWVPVDSY